ncbi:MAG: MATE family efflux transporter [Dehalococcoidales bacterium]|nr:MATE family efflux transporter [Dehalococcoidales bacterium]
MHNPNSTILDTDKIGRLLVRLALPSFIGMFVMTLYNVVNTIFIGHYVGPLGIAGLSIVFPFQMLGMGLAQMMGTGGASLISRLLGQRNISRAERTLGNAFALNIIISLTMTAAGLSNPEFWLRLAGASDTIMPYAKEYMVIIISGIILNNIVMASNTLTVSQGNARIPMIANIMGAILNIILDAIFIIGMDMGVRGAAIGTVIAQGTSATFFLIYYFSGRSFLKVHLKNLVPDLSIIRPIMAVGVAAFAMTFTASLSNIIVNRTLEAYGSDLAISAMGILNRILMFALMPGVVIGQGLQPILGFNYGAGRYDRILRAIKMAITATTLIGLAAFIALYFFPGVFFRVFTSDTALIDLGSLASKRVFLCMYLIGFMGIGSMTFVALGKAARSFIASISRTIVFLIPCVIIFSNIMGLEGVWFAFPASDILAFILMLVLLIPLIKDFRRKLELRREGDQSELASAQELNQRE